MIGPMQNAPRVIGKTFEHNFILLKELWRLSSLNLPLLVGLSRKAFIGNLMVSPVGDRLYGSLGAAAVAIQNGAHIIRVHDVMAHKQLAAMMDRTLFQKGF